MRDAFKTSWFEGFKFRSWQEAGEGVGWERDSLPVTKRWGVCTGFGRRRWVWNVKENLAEVATALPLYNLQFWRIGRDVESWSASFCIYVQYTTPLSSHSSVLLNVLIFKVPDPNERKLMHQRNTACSLPSLRERKRTFPKTETMKTTAQKIKLTML